MFPPTLCGTCANERKRLRHNLDRLLQIWDRSHSFHHYSGAAQATLQRLGAAEPAAVNAQDARGDVIRGTTGPHDVDRFVTRLQAQLDEAIHYLEQNGFDTTRTNGDGRS